MSSRSKRAKKESFENGDSKTKKVKVVEKNDNAEDQDADNDSAQLTESAPKSSSIVLTDKDGEEDEYGGQDYRKLVQLKSDHTSRPLWVSPDGHIFLESFSPVYKHAHDFLIAISELDVRGESFYTFSTARASLPTRTCS